MTNPRVYKLSRKENECIRDLLSIFFCGKTTSHYFAPSVCLLLSFLKFAFEPNNTIQSFLGGGRVLKPPSCPVPPPQSWPRPDSAILVWSPGVGGGAEGYKICCDKTGMKNIDHICTPFLRNSAEDSRFSHNFITFIENVYAIVMSKFSFSALCAGEKPVSLMSFNVKANICPF